MCKRLCEGRRGRIRAAEGGGDESLERGFRPGFQAVQGWMDGAFLNLVRTKVCKISIRLLFLWVKARKGGLIKWLVCLTD